MEVETQSLAVSQKTEDRYAGFWIRVLAACIDFVILAAIGYLLFGSEVTKISAGQGSLSAKITYYGWKASVPVLYTFLFWTFFSATPGKLACGIGIIKTDDTRLSWKRALLRLVAYVPSAVVLFIGFIWVGFERHKQGWHDKIAETYVVRTR